MLYNVCIKLYYFKMLFEGPNWQIYENAWGRSLYFPPFLFCPQLYLSPRNLYYRNGYSWLNCAPILHLNIDGAPKLKKCFYIKYGGLNLRRQFLTSLLYNIVRRLAFINTIT